MAMLTARGTLTVRSRSRTWVEQSQLPFFATLERNSLRLKRVQKLNKLISGSCRILQNQTFFRRAPALTTAPRDVSIGIWENKFLPDLDMPVS
jgi:hypothetical protein